jgi:hypothetical protein
MNLKGIIMIVVWALAALPASAQMRIISRDKVEAVSNPRLSADSASLAFATRHIVAEPMTEDDAPKTFIYRFENIGDKELNIVRLVSTCSCASATCSVKSVAPGASAEISVKYYPKGHPGRFERKVFVYTGDGNDPAAVLRLSVDVAGGSDHSVQWPVQMGGIRLRQGEIRFIQGQKAVETISFINLTGKTLKLECETMFLPQCFTFSSDPVESGAEGVIKVTYDPAKPGVRENVKLILKGLDLPPSQSSITIKTTVK